MPFNYGQWSNSDSSCRKFEQQNLLEVKLNQEKVFFSSATNLFFKDGGLFSLFLARSEKDKIFDRSNVWLDKFSTNPNKAKKLRWATKRIHQHAMNKCISWLKQKKHLGLICICLTRKILPFWSNETQLAAQVARTTRLTVEWPLQNRPSCQIWNFDLTNWVHWPGQQSNVWLIKRTIWTTLDDFWNQSYEFWIYGLHISFLCQRKMFL
jgi:hypothetical protein